MKGKRKSKKRSEPKGDKSQPKGNLPREILDGVSHDLQRLGVIGNLVVGIILLLVGPIVLYFIQGIRGSVIAAGVGLTLALWLLVFLVIRQIGPQPVAETEFHGVLVPANDPAPPNPCTLMEPGAIVLYLGATATYTNPLPAGAAQKPYAVITAGDEVVLSIEKTAEGMSLNAIIRSPDNRAIASIEKNEFHLNPNNYFYRKRPDKSTLIIYDQENHEVLNVRYLNPSAVQILGLFINHNGTLVTVQPKKLTVGGFSFRGGCIGGGSRGIVL